MDQRPDDVEVLVVPVAPTLTEVAFGEGREDHVIEAVPVGPDHRAVRYQANSLHTPTTIAKIWRRKPL